MLPTTSHLQAQLHAEELHRRAAAHRAVVAHRIATVDPRRTLRSRAGTLLVELGARLQGGSLATSPTATTMRLAGGRPGGLSVTTAANPPRSG